MEELFFFFFKQKTAYEIRKGDWSSDVCSSDLIGVACDSVAALVARALHEEVSRRDGAIDFGFQDTKRRVRAHDPRHFRPHAACTSRLDRRGRDRHGNPGARAR